MISKDALVGREEQVVRLKAAMSDATTATSAVDMSLVMLVAEIVHGPPIVTQDMELASIIVFGHGTVERKIDVTRRILMLRLGNGLKAKPHEYPFKVATFMVQAFNKIADMAKKDTWIRNTAAHGNIFMGRPGDEPKLIPSPLDFDGVKRHHEKRGGRGPAGFVPTNGFTADELQAFAIEVKDTQKLFGRFADLMKILMTGGPTAAFESGLVALGKDLKLQAPLQVRPHRGKTKPAGPKPGRR